ncbi:unnamed protein product [Adineta ricciae]|uniref:Uncharacterized protein n=1 Tax=Adineta ricciae TaxID=249248 RepID=A0A815NW02_ADIRI|nr:unnamed protein product [Adineta ricciae]CAF1649314.1 unnamed protein product [Adineta ricciae]
MEDLKFLYDRDDFKQVWLEIAAEIKIRTYDKLHDVYELKALPNRVQNEIIGFARGVKFNYETFYDTGNVYSTAHVVLIIQENGNWLGMFPYHYTTTLTKAIVTALGCGVLVGGIYYFCSASPQYLQSLIKFILENSKEVMNGLAGLAKQLFTKEAFNTFVKWLTNDNSAWHLLIAVCILRKLQGIRTS